jgi:hypothetical protein
VKISAARSEFHGMLNGFGGSVQIVGELEGAGEGVIGLGGFRSESDGFACFASGAWRIVRLGKR